MKNLISVLIPIHGDSPYLEKTLQSIARSTLRSFDLVLVLDRCSNSNINRYISSLPDNISVKVYQSDIPGIVQALNLGLSKIESEYVARIDADDEMSPNRLENQLLYLQSEPGVVCVGSQVSLIDENSEPFGFTRYPTDSKEIEKRLLFQKCIAHPSVMDRKKL
jgi:glycosyltransferase involved in cell wall biosynthesis